MEAEQGQNSACLAAAEALVPLVASLLAQQRAQQSAPFVWEPSLVELAAQHPASAEVLLRDAEGLRRQLVDLLVDGGHLARGERLWLHPVPAGLLACETGVTETLATLRAAPGHMLVVHGVCIAATAVFSRKYAATLRCKLCHAEATVLEGERHGGCCGAGCEEVEAQRVMVPAQVVWLAQESSAGGGEAYVGVRQLAVHLSDDLCGRVRIGDRALVAGAGALVLPPGARELAAAPRLLAGAQLAASSLLVLRSPPLLVNPHELSPGARQHLSAMAGGSVASVLACMDAWQGVPCSPLLKLALLVSAAASGQQPARLPDAATEEGEAAEGPEAYLLGRVGHARQQVNVLVYSQGPEPHLRALLRAAAAQLCQQSVRARTDAKQLLPRLDAKHVEPSLRLVVPLALGGLLAEANAGVLLLSSATLTTKHALGLAQAVHAGEAALALGCPELTVPVTATLWSEVHEADLGRARAAGLPPAEAVMCRLGLRFWAEQDLVLDQSRPSENEEDLVADWMLGGAEGGDVGEQGARAAAADAADALAALRVQLARARAAPPPRLLPEAMAVLSAYYLMRRAGEEAEAGADLLARLCRVAAGAARLCSSAEVAPFPHAALAIAYAEERAAAAGSPGAHWPQWADELDRGTDLEVCLGGLLDAVCKDAGAAWGGGAHMRAEE